MTLVRCPWVGFRVVGRETSARSTERHPSGHREGGRAGKESVNIYNLPGKGKRKANVGPGRDGSDTDRGRVSQRKRAH